jgi:hypothetical protein
MIYTKENLIASIENEFRIFKHLWEKIPAGTEGYRPTEGQRTTLELLQYLSSIFANATHVILQGSTDAYANAPCDASQTTMENFPAKMDEQLSIWKGLLDQFDEVELAKTTNLYGMGEMTKGRYLVENLLKWAAAYKMQLFLYCKASGNSSINTANLWGGVDMPMNQ